jgi:hypothetical protein
MTTITVQRPLEVLEPRAAAVAAAIFGRLMTWLESSRAQRAESRERADRAAEAAAVRQYAQRYASHDPRFAADLLAAADRHETSDSAPMLATAPGVAATQAARSFTDSLRASRTS